MTELVAVAPIVTPYTNDKVIKANRLRDNNTLVEKYKAEEAKPENVELNQEFMPLFHAQPGDEIKPYNPFEFSTLISLLQIPHLHIKEEVAKRNAKPLIELY